MKCKHNWTSWLEEIICMDTHNRIPKGTTVEQINEWCRSKCEDCGDEVKGIPDWNWNKFYGIPDN